MIENAMDEHSRVFRIRRENGGAPSKPEERDWRQYVTLIGLEIEHTIPDPSEITTLDAVRLLVRENTALRKAVGLPTYHQLETLEDEERYGQTGRS
jgi:hypothetical protein